MALLHFCTIAYLDHLAYHCISAQKLTIDSGDRGWDFCLILLSSSLHRSQAKLIHHSLGYRVVIDVQIDEH